MDKTTIITFYRQPMMFRSLFDFDVKFNLLKPTEDLLEQKFSSCQSSFPKNCSPNIPRAAAEKAWCDEKKTLKTA